MRQSGGEGGPGGYADDTRVSSMSSMVEGRFFRPMLCKGVLHTSVRLRPSPPSCPSAARPAHPTRRSARPPRAGRPSTSRRAQGRAGWRSRSGSGAVRYDGGQVSGEGHGAGRGQVTLCVVGGAVGEQCGNSVLCCAGAGGGRTIICAVDCPEDRMPAGHRGRSQDGGQDRAHDCVRSSEPRRSMDTRAAAAAAVQGTWFAQALSRSGAIETHWWPSMALSVLPEIRFSCHHNKGEGSEARGVSNTRPALRAPLRLVTLAKAMRGHSAASSA